MPDSKDGAAAEQVAMDFTCYLHLGWDPRIRPADPRRDWMDGTPESFAYRCLPLAIANAHGWEILSPMSFDASWNGGTGTDAVSIALPAGARADLAPVSIFGHGVLSFHIFGLFRTEPGWNLWAGGSPNSAKDGIAPLTGVIETDWSPYTFTMNWRFTRPHHSVRFDEGEAICFLFPVQRGVLERMRPRLLPLEDNPQLFEQFKAWSRSRDAFQEQVRRNPPKSAADRWQKRYFHGIDMQDQQPADDHQTKLRLQPFTHADGRPATLPARSAVAEVGQNPAAAAPAAQPAARPKEIDQNQLAKALHAISSDLVDGADFAALSPTLAQHGITGNDANELIRTVSAHPLVVQGRARSQHLRKRDWLLNVQEQHRTQGSAGVSIERCAKLSREEFYERYFSANRPVILIGEMAEWQALAKWTPAYLRSVVGEAVVEYQGDRRRNPQFETQKDAHRGSMRFDHFIDRILAPDAGNDAYITAYNSTSNVAALAPLHADLGVPSVLSAEGSRQGMMWIGPAGTFTPLHHDLTDNLIAQVVGRKRLRIVAAADVAKVYNHHHVFSAVPDLDAQPAELFAAFPALAEARIYDVTLAPGEMIFMPIGWWHQVKSLDFSVTLTYTGFDGRRNWHESFPSA